MTEVIAADAGGDPQKDGRRDSLRKTIVFKKISNGRNLTKEKTHANPMQPEMCGVSRIE